MMKGLYLCYSFHHLYGYVREVGEGNDLVVVVVVVVVVVPASVGTRRRM